MSIAPPHLPPLSDWLETKTKLHLVSQIVGKIRLGLSPELNHWWHAPLYVSARGLTTSAIPYGDLDFDLELDLLEHQLVLRTSVGAVRRLDLGGPTIARFYEELFSVLADLGIEPRILAEPFDPSKVRSEVPFASDHGHAAYEGEQARRYWRALLAVDGILKEFRGRFLGKSSPVHFFGHSFDLAGTRVSGRDAAVGEDADPVAREAYSHEVISAGFWPGDDNVPEPAFYCYVHPEPPGLASEALTPDTARWESQNGGSLALYRYEDFRSAADPQAALLDFLQSTYDAGARLADWPTGKLERR